MIKAFTTFLALFFICSALSAQNIRLQPDAYALQLPEGRTSFRVDRQQVLIRFTNKLNEQSLGVFFETQGVFMPFEKSWVLPFPDGVVATFNQKLDDEEYLQQLAALNRLEGVSFTAPVMMYNEKIQQAVYDLFYVKIKDRQQLEQLSALAVQLRFTVEKEYMDGIYFCRINKNSAGNAFEIAKHIQSLNLFQFAEPDFVIWGESNTLDPLYAQQWHLKNTGAQFSGSVAGADLDIENAWTLTTGIPQIKVAVLDCFGSLTQFTHNDFAFQVAYDATGTGFNSSTYQGDAHGINCGGLIGATTNNNVGVAGISYNSKVYAVKIGTISNAQGNWNSTGNSISNGIVWAYQNAHVISNSNSFGSSSSLVDNAIANSISIGRWGKGTPFFSSSGNNGISTIGYPASNANTIAVGASTVDDTRASFSNYDVGLDIVAPGVSVYSTDIAGASGYSTNDYFLFSGTSAACPVAAGVMALILSLDSNLTHAQARAKIEQSCEKVGGYTYSTNVSGQPNGTWNSNNGYGRVSAYNAVLLAANTPPANDAISSAANINVNASCNSISGNLVAATQSIAPASCSGALATSAKDVWYSFTASQRNVSIYCTGGLRTDVVLGLYSGTSSSPVLMQCTDVAGMNGTDVIHAANLILNNTYYIRVYDFNDNAFTTDFSLCVRTTPVITNNTISGAQQLCGNSVPTQLSGSQPAGGAGFTLEGYKVYSDLTSANLPAGWSVPLTQDTLLRFSSTLNSYDRPDGKGAILANNFNVVAGKRAQLQTNPFAPGIATDTLRFDVAHAAYNSNADDSLIVYAKVGTSFVRVTGWRSSSTINTAGITTANAQTAYFIPGAGQWITKKVALPLNTTQVRFEFYSGYGNQLYIDKIIVDSSVSSYSYQWVQSITSANSGFSAIANSNSASYTPGALAQNTWFKRLVLSSGYVDSSAAVLVTINPLPKAGYTINNPVQMLSGNSFGFVDTSSNVNTRLWNFGNNTTSASLNPSKTYAAAGIYAVKLRITTNKGCSDSVTKEVKVYPNAPTTSANSFFFQSVTTTSMNVSWNAGNGQQRLLLVKQGSAVNAIPVNGTSYSPDPQFGSGSQIGTGNYVALNENYNGVLLTNLLPNTTYYFALFEYNGDAALISYQQTGYLTGSKATLLPVNWLSFNASKSGADVALNWSTAWEKNNKGFEVEYSADGNDFKTAGFVHGKGNTNAVSTYDFIHLNAFENLHSGNTLYYRLKQLDLDGRYDYSPTRSVENNFSGQAGLFTVYPNPNQGEFFITLSQETITRIGLYDVYGKLVKELTPGGTSLKVDARGLATGVYFIKAQSAGNSTQHKIVIE